MKRRQGMSAGLTLLELLVGMALLGIILTALSSFFTQSSTSSVQSSARADLQQETLNVQQLIAGRVKAAWYIYPADQTLQLGATPTSTAALRRNPIPGTTRTGTATWLTGTEPILAMILPPRIPGSTCSTSTTTGCFWFYAYYPVQRSVWLSATVDTDGIPSASHPGTDPLNNSTWVMAEYRRALISFDPAVLSTAVLSGGDANLLADYVAPTVATTGFTTTTPVNNTYTMFSYLTDPGTSAPVNGVTVRLAAIRRVGAKTLRLPSSVGTYDISVVSPNLGKVAIN